MPGIRIDPLDLHIEPATSGIAGPRAELREWLRNTGASDSEQFDILAAASEAIANAIEHPLDRTSTVVGLTATQTDGKVYVAVRDCGAWQPHRQRTHGGYGFLLMRSLMDTVEVTCDPDGTTIELARTIGCAPTE